MRLNLGAGNTRIEGFTNVDHVKLPETDIVSKVDNLGFCLKNSVDEIYASSVIIHYTLEEVGAVLKEWYRVLKRGSKIYISCPDIMAVNDYINKNGWDCWIASMVYAGNYVYNDVIKSAYDFNMMRIFLEDAGFTKVYRIEKMPHGIIDGSCCTAKDTIENKKILLVFNCVAEKP